MTAFVLGRLRRPRRPRRLPTMLAVALIAGLLLTGTAVAPVAAADQLRMAVSTTYRVDPAKLAIHVTLDIRATNQKADTATTFYWYDSATFVVPVEARSVRATSNGSRLNVTTATRKSFRDITIHYPNLYHGKTRTMRLTFDLPSGKPRSDSPFRVGKAHTAFFAWAFGDPGLGAVRIVMPPDFQADIETVPDDDDAQLTSASVNGRRVYSVKDLADPTGWYSLIEASNRDALTDVHIQAGGEPVLIHAWPEDTEWLERVSTVLEDSLPDLTAAIGLPWPVSEELEVSEVTSEEIEGYAGFFDSADEEITISEDLEDLVIVHEASHAWFDASLFQERWIGEGLADEYASRVLAADHPGDLLEGPLPVSATDAAAFALNTWSPPNRVDDDSAAYERFGYNASWTVMREIVDDVSEARMRDVFAAASARTVDYVGAGPAEVYGFAPDWRRFLDLVTDVGGSTKAEGLFKTWVLTPNQKEELAIRDTVRTRYFALVTAGDDWLPGIVIRKPMSDWRFADATDAITDAQTVLAARDGLTAATSELGIALPTGLESDYESADANEDLTGLATRISGWTEAATTIRAARDELAKERPPLVALGLYDTDPSAGYDAAVAAFAAGDQAGVLAGSAASVAALAGAEEIGRGRATTAGVAAGVVVALLVLLVIVVVWRRRRHQQAMARVTSVSSVAATSASGGAIWTDQFAAAAPTGPAEPVPPPPVGVRSLVWSSDPGALAPPPEVSASPDVPPPPTDVVRLGTDPPPADATTGFATEDPYATLAATPDLAGGSEAGGPGARGAEPD